jgi:hypothetical protein
MFKKLQAVAVLVCMLSYSAAATVSIGTASARGDMRVDSYMVNGNATLFNGSVVETDQASADLRLQEGVQITMATSSRATVYRNRMVLQQGGSELTASSPFQLETSALRVTPNDPNSHFVVLVKPGNTVEVDALKGTVGVASDHGVLLASVHPGRAFSFAIRDGGDNSEFSAMGKVSVNNGMFFFTVTETGVVYELRGIDLKKFVGKQILVIGVVDANATPAPGAAAVITVANIGVSSGGGGTSAGHKNLIIAGVAVAGAAAIGIGVVAASHSSSPASR